MQPPPSALFSLPRTVTGSYCRAGTARWFDSRVAAAPNEDVPEQPGWRLLASKVLHRTRWFSVHADSVTRPDGSAGVYEHVVSRGSVTVLAIDTDDRVAVTRQWIYTHGTRQWRLPGGGIDPGDSSPLAAASRELAEETGVQAAYWAQIGTVHCADSLSNHVEHVFRATGLTLGDDQHLEPGETDLEVSWIPFSQALELVAGGEVPHAGSSYAILREALRRPGRLPG
jgi:8-oxo-dGTP pyrophosphatase MutT (NUDIX family)